jgi:hypothetical protein
MLRITLLVLNTLFGVTQGSISDCAKGTSLFKINNLQFFPDPSTRNENTTVVLDYTVPDGTYVSAGTATYEPTFNYIKYPSTVDDLCVKMGCPILPGSYSPSSSTVMPNLAGTLSIKTTWRDDLNNILLCYTITTKLSL